MSKAQMSATLVALTCLLLGSTSVAGELQHRTISRSNEWEPTDCDKPSQPSFYVHDAFSYNMAVDEYNSYVSEVRSYLSCISDEAEGDLRIFRDILEDSLDEITNDLTSDVEAANSNLIYSRSMIE